MYEPKKMKVKVESKRFDLKVKVERVKKWSKCMKNRLKNGQKV